MSRDTPEIDETEKVSPQYYQTTQAVLVQDSAEEQRTPRTVNLKHSLSQKSSGSKKNKSVQRRSKHNRTGRDRNMN